MPKQKKSKSRKWLNITARRKACQGANYGRQVRLIVLEVDDRIERQGLAHQFVSGEVVSAAKLGFDGRFQLRCRIIAHQWRFGRPVTTRSRANSPKRLSVNLPFPLGDGVAFV